MSVGSWIVHSVYTLRIVPEFISKPVIIVIGDNELNSGDNTEHSIMPDENMQSIWIFIFLVKLKSYKYKSEVYGNIFSLLNPTSMFNYFLMVLTLVFLKFYMNITIKDGALNVIHKIPEFNSNSGYSLNLYMLVC